MTAEFAQSLSVVQVSIANDFVEVFRRPKFHRTAFGIDKSNNGNEGALRRIKQKVEAEPIQVEVSRAHLFPVASEVESL